MFCVFAKFSDGSVGMPVKSSHTACDTSGATGVSFRGSPSPSPPAPSRLTVEEIVRGSSIPVTTSALFVKTPFSPGSKSLLYVK